MAWTTTKLYVDIHTGELINETKLKNYDIIGKKIEYRPDNIHYKNHKKIIIYECRESTNRQGNFNFIS
jgi:hypothetical protein